jgi:hypothetical protein
MPFFLIFHFFQPRLTFAIMLEAFNVELNDRFVALKGFIEQTQGQRKTEGWKTINNEMNRQKYADM